MQVPSIHDLVAHPAVLSALEDAWTASLADDPARRHEEGGWVFADASTGDITTRRAPAGGRAILDLDDPPVVAGSVVVATFHTHPNPASEGWMTGPSDEDMQSAWLLGVPCFIRAEDGIHSTGPAARRGGWSGGPGFPP